MPSKPVIYWFRNDLRLHDNPALLEALAKKSPLFPVFVIDPQWSSNETPLGFPRMGALRQQFLMESLGELKEALEKTGNTLHLFRGNTIDIIPKLYRGLKASGVIAQREYAWEEISLEKKLSQQVTLELHWGSMLYQPDQVDFPLEKSPFYYTKFKNRVTSLTFLPLPAKAPLEIPAPASLNLPKQPEEIPFSPTSPLPQAERHFKGGEASGLMSLDHYFNDQGPLHYSETRNFFEGNHFSSLLGPWLANGSISPRYFYHRLDDLKQVHPDHRESVQTLIEQLIWRDNFRYLFLRYGSKFFTTKGLRKSPPGMFDDREAFLRWKNGKTGQPLIDSLMRQLAITGFMSNRGRMLVSFYLAKEMKVNWQWGASWFESALLDYDVCSNYGNWAYQSGRGTDSRVNRRFNLEKQAAKFDPDGHFVEKWSKRTPQD